MNKITMEIWKQARKLSTAKTAKADEKLYNFTMDKVVEEMKNEKEKK